MRCTAPLVMLPSVRAAPPRSTESGSSGEPVPPVMAGLAGVWDGTLYRAGAEDGVPFSLVQEGAASGAAVGQLAFTGTGMGPLAVQLLEASASTYVALVGPYYDPAAEAEMVTVLEGRTAGDRLFGTYRVRPVTGGRAVGGRFVAVRSRRAA